MKRFYTISLVFILSTLFATAAPKKEVYVPMDYSTCGYHASETALPDVAVKVFLQAEKGDQSAEIQRAIDYLSTQKPDAQGFRGAILLSEGTFNIDKALRISTSGIVIRGTNINKTILRKQGVDRGAALYIEGGKSVYSTDTLTIAQEKTLAGATILTLTDTGSLKVGDKIAITRPCTKEWIAMLKMNDFGGNLDYTGWKATDIDIRWHRTITAIDGNKVTIDAPITTTLDTQWGTSFIVKVNTAANISECAIENLTMESAVNDWNPKDEDHCWDAVFMDNAYDCWVRNVRFSQFAGSAVNLQKATQRITVQDCIAENPVSEIGGWRRNVFTTRGEQCLFQRCISREGIHDFSTGFCAAGPNAFVQCEGEGALGFSGSIGSWCGGVLFDVVNIEGHDLSFRNLEQFQFGTGWNAANSMFWQCTASTIYCYSPDPDNRNSGHGCWATLTGDGEWTSSNDHVSPRSLFYDQLGKRCPDTTVKGFLLPRNTNASSSPTVEQAAVLAKETLTTPRLTLEMWLDSIPFTASTEATSAMTSQEIVALQAKNAKKSKAKKGKKASDSKHDITIQDGKLLFNGKPIRGNKYNITWWSGRVKDNFVQSKAAKFSPTRFVPGREGIGWTDRIDSIVDFMERNHYAVLDHNYGLWYDLRRTDHERVKRADGDVWAPFYEQPFARSGKGKAWDGLSLYDLSRPNEWYWHRLRSFAEKALPKGILLYNQHYFQHNILEAGAHWVDCPWRPVNNVNYEASKGAKQANGGNMKGGRQENQTQEVSTLPEPVPFTGDKRIFVAEQFYDICNPVMAKYHRQYIRMALEQTKDNPNIIQFLSEEYTGPEHFTRFWLQTIKDWQAETGRDVLVALSCTKDVQDAILADKELSAVVDIIDIRYWHYNTKECWSPKGGQNLAPRQHIRKWKIGSVGEAEVRKAVSEYRQKFPEKVVIYNAPNYDKYGKAIEEAGGSVCNN